ncbi:MAG: hypothetical protein IID32_02290 [Planctomycetes bacterium]|nr:hypothetical protein [Planctomycetota bacterium]
MKKTLTIVFAAALMVGFWSGCKQDEGGGGNGESGKKESGAKVETTSTTATALAQTLCPIGGGDIVKNSFTDYQGKRVYFCCDDCKPKFDKDADNIIAKMESDGIKLATVN